VFNVVMLEEFVNAPPIGLDEEPKVRVDDELPPDTTRFVRTEASDVDEVEVNADGTKLVAAVGRMRLMFSIPSRFAVLTEVAPLAMVTVSVSVPAPPTTDNVDELEAVWIVKLSLPEPPTRVSLPPEPVTVNAVPIEDPASAFRTPANPEALTAVVLLDRVVLVEAPRKLRTPAATPPVTVIVGVARFATPRVPPTVDPTTRATVSILPTESEVARIPLRPAVAVLFSLTVTESLVVLVRRPNVSVPPKVVAPVKPKPSSVPATRPVIASESAV